MSDPLLPSVASVVTDGYQPCAKFLLESEIGIWYEGTIIVRNVSGFKKALEVIKFRSEEQVFISHKFEYTINHEPRPRTFCITFRKDPHAADVSTSLGGRLTNTFLIRLSLIEFEDPTNPVIKCKERESLVIIPKLFVKNGIKIPTKKSAEFSSITSGKKGDKIVEVNMGEMGERDNEYKDFFERYINPKMNDLGKILVEHCDPPNITASGGGATRNRKSVFKRKCKKSYRKNKYSKTKKSRKFRRSGRSRR